MDQFGDWTFQIGKRLNGNFQVDTYYPCGPQTACGPGGQNVGVGAAFGLKYVPSAGDPGLSEVNWIQRVQSNHAVNGSHGAKEDIVDNPQNPSLPYYYPRGYKVEVTGSVSPISIGNDNPANMVKAPELINKVLLQLTTSRENVAKPSLALSKPSETTFTDVEKWMPELLAEMRNDLPIADF